LFVEFLLFPKTLAVLRLGRSQKDAISRSMPPKRTLQGFFSETRPLWEMGLAAVLALLLALAALHLAWLAGNIGQTMLIILILGVCYSLYLICQFFRLAYGTVEIVIGLFAIFDAMGRSPKVVDDPAIANLLLVQMAAGMYVVIRGFDNFAQSKPFAGGSTAFRAVWDIAKILWVRIPAKDLPLDMASNHNPSNLAAALREALIRVWNCRPRLTTERSLALGTWALAAVGLWALRDSRCRGRLASPRPCAGLTGTENTAIPRS
jgi:hypothetical protein